MNIKKILLILMLTAVAVSAVLFFRLREPSLTEYVENFTGVQLSDIVVSESGELSRNYADIRLDLIYEGTDTARERFEDRRIAPMPGELEGVAKEDVICKYTIFYKRNRWSQARTVNIYLVRNNRDYLYMRG